VGGTPIFSWEEGERGGRGGGGKEGQRGKGGKGVKSNCLPLIRTGVEGEGGSRLFSSYPGRNYDCQGGPT